MPNNTLLEVKDLKMYFENKKGFLGKKIEYVKAVDGVSFKIQKGDYQTERQRTERVPQISSDDFPGSICIPESSYDGFRYYR